MCGTTASLSLSAPQARRRAAGLGCQWGTSLVGLAGPEKIEESRGQTPRTQADQSFWNAVMVAAPTVTVCTSTMIDDGRAGVHPSVYLYTRCCHSLNRGSE